MFDDLAFMEALKVENCETPSRSHQSSTVPDAMSSSKTNDELQSSATPHANNVEELTYENNTEACVQDQEHQSCDPADFEEWAVSKEYFCRPQQSQVDPKCVNNDTVVSMEISISDECSLF
ncbi:hypothetical protein U9M48_030177 [Paspalum notatum var. saurae]|uniref:Uncharacterized protein n=1 Tax=Paspalum notatum var. saurae TaxID=547442 RepID=A0AAQ3TZV0_PASNO